jgi:hypothetical protein
VTGVRAINQLILSRADVVVDGQTYEGSRIAALMRDHSARVTPERGSEQLAARSDVTGIVHLGGKGYRVTFADGSTWEVTRTARPCGCR